jgi:N-carbamoyl-L-amino-acid hydrolase
MDLHVDVDRVWGELEHLASFSDAPAPAVTRVLYTKTDLEARHYIKSLCDEAGFKWREDALGTLFVRLEGSDSSLSAVGTGSHTDAIPHSGRFDGTLGVLGGLEALRALKRAGFQPRRSLEVVMFTSEEPTRFGVGCLSSRAMSGAFTVDQVRALRDTEGRDLESVRIDAGFTGSLESVKLEPGHYATFVELHIEQGPILEQRDLPIGIVTAIAAPASFFVRLTGEGGHAGARLMPGRRDALLAASEIALSVEEAALDTGAIDTVGTTGICEIHPGAINSIPSQATLGIDIRDIDGARRDLAVQQVLEDIEEIGSKRGVAFEIEMINSDPPASSDPAVLDAIRAACDDMNLPRLEMVSRAYHDSLFMARISPISMIFIPCRGGVSHRPDEYAKPKDIATGIEVLARTMAKLAS